MSSEWIPDWAMVFAAGRGVRMMPLTADRPKPMLPVAGKPLLAHALDRVAEAGIRQAVVNVHHCAEVVEAYLPTRTSPPVLKLSREETLLETGGGVKKALTEGLLATDAPFLAVNADILWTDAPDGGPSAIRSLSRAWACLGGAVDVLLLLVPRAAAWGHEAPLGDYAFADDAGRLRRLSKSPAPYIYAGLQITRPVLYRDPALGSCFSNLRIFDAAQEKGRLFGVVHRGGWFHFTTPDALTRFEAEQSGTRRENTG